ncbi:MAG TPA: hypothetical protein VFE98_02820 [Candidatus Bathyarchaeia archaeon]|nr:hypothetical protein [Candidatus Bathyarchaeia archaeon]
MVGAVDASILGLFLYLYYNYWTPGSLDSLVSLAPILYLIPLLILMFRFTQKRRFYKRQWQEEHPRSP